PRPPLLYPRRVKRGESHVAARASLSLPSLAESLCHHSKERPMMRAWSLAVAAGLALAPTGLAAPANCRFQWQAGRGLSYHVEETTSKTETLEGKSIETSTKMANDKRWQVLDVDAAGVATLQMSLTALRFELTTPSGEVLLYDSKDKEKSNPQMAEQLGKYINTPLAVLRIDSLGRLIEVKQTMDNHPGRYEIQLP